MWRLITRWLATDIYYDSLHVRAEMNRLGRDELVIKLGKREYSYNPRDLGKPFGPKTIVTYRRFSNGKVQAWRGLAPVPDKE